MIKAEMLMIEKVKGFVHVFTDLPYKNVISINFKNMPDYNVSVTRLDNGFYRINRSYDTIIRRCRLTDIIDLYLPGYIEDKIELL